VPQEEGGSKEKDGIEGTKKRSTEKRWERRTVIKKQGAGRRAEKKSRVARSVSYNAVTQRPSFKSYCSRQHEGTHASPLCV
jgi:hypothetical protein